MRASRRSFLIGLSGVAAASSCAALLPSCAAPGDPRELALSRVIERVLLPNVQDIARASHKLQAAIAPLCAAPSDATLAAAQLAFRDACAAWQRGYAFQEGPLVTTGALLRAAFWPVQPRAISELLTADTPIDAEQIAALGVDKKGLFALEQLLFSDPSEAAPQIFSRPERRARAAQLTAALAADVVAHAERASTALGDGTSYRDEFARAGQSSLNRLVNLLLNNVEGLVMRLQRTVRLADTHRLRSTDVQAAKSGMSNDVLRAWFSVCTHIYHADRDYSLAALVQRAAPALASPLEQRFTLADQALSAVSAPLDHAVREQPQRVSAALDTLRALEVAVRAEVVSALGVTLTFTSSDGD
jgi:predicted lipoprotein